MDRFDSKLILLVEDRREYMQMIKDWVSPLGCRLITASRGLEGLRLAREQKPDLILLDQGLPDLTGQMVARELRNDPVTSTIPILFLTVDVNQMVAYEAGADDYAHKTWDKEVIQAKIQVFLRRQRAPYPEECCLAVQAQNNQRMTITGSGSVVIRAGSRNTVDLNPEVSAREAIIALSADDWQFAIRQLGHKIHKTMFDHEELLGIYQFLRGWTHDKAPRLRLRFECNRSELGVPFEFLFDQGLNEQSKWLVLEHPISRRIQGVTRVKTLFSETFIKELASRNEPLEVLLIASNTLPDIPGVDAEIDWLRSNLERVLTQAGVTVNVTALPTDDAEINTVRDSLRLNKYHLIHYAGHGEFVAEDPGQSKLLFWNGAKRTGGVQSLKTIELTHLLRDSETRLIYLSCCFGTTSGRASDLLSHDFLGIADAVIRAGVPTVLGFRQPVSDHGAVLFAQKFYSELALSQDPEIATLHARSEAYAQIADDPVWLSPILIQQN